VEDRSDLDSHLNKKLDFFCEFIKISDGRNKAQNRQAEIKYINIWQKKSLIISSISSEIEDLDEIEIIMFSRIFLDFLMILPKFLNTRFLLSNHQRKKKK